MQLRWESCSGGTNQTQNGYFSKPCHSTFFTVWIEKSSKIISSILCGQVLFETYLKTICFLGGLRGFFVSVIPIKWPVPLLQLTWQPLLAVQTATCLLWNAWNHFFPPASQYIYMNTRKQVTCVNNHWFNLVTVYLCIHGRPVIIFLLFFWLLTLFWKHYVFYL